MHSLAMTRTIAMLAWAAAGLMARSAWIATWVTWCDVAANAGHGMQTPYSPLTWSQARATLLRWHHKVRKTRCL